MILIQPLYKSAAEYEALANSSGLLFEVLELSIGGIQKESYHWYRSCGMVRSVHGRFIDVNPASGDPLIKELSEKRYEESCRLAEELRAKSVVFHSTCFPFLRGYYLEAWANTCADFFTRLSEAHPELDIFIENSFDTDPGPMKKLIDMVKKKNVGICLDIGHIHYSRASLDDWFDALGDRTGYIHLSDNMGIYDDHLPIGRGSVDWKRADALCSALPRGIPMTLEVGGPDGIAASLEYINTKGYFGGLL